ncbi:MAG: I78 family peptidase inhibitor [Caulobacterales bacterium]|jgi:hypothetical protein
MSLRVAILALAVAACAAPPAPGGAPFAPPVKPATCDPALYSGLIGTAAQAISPASLPSSHRIVCFECAMTMDFSADRLTLMLDREGKVARVACQ